MLYINSTMGASFCHVKIKRQFSQDSPSITSGNQKWNGAIPILVTRAEFIIRSGRKELSIFLYILVLVIKHITDIRITVDAIA